MFAVNTGFRCGDIFDLKWEEVDLEQRWLSIIMGKTRRKLEVALNDTALAVLEAKEAAKHGPYVFYNPVTGDRFFDIKAGWKAALQTARVFAASPGIPSGTLSPHGSRSLASIS